MLYSAKSVPVEVHLVVVEVAGVDVDAVLETADVAPAEFEGA